MKRDTTKVIWRTVVFAGAMLGAPACGGKAKPAEPTPSNDQQAQPTSPETTPPQTPDPANPCNPCGGERPRGGDEEGGMGRGFILS